MSPTTKIEVEPLGDERWEKIERGIFAELAREQATRTPVERRPARVWRWRPAAALVIAGAVAAAIGAIATRSIWPAEHLASASRIVTAGGGSHVALGEASLDVGPDSEVLVSGDDERGVLVVLDRGKVECEVAPRRDRPPFVVQAGETRVRVVGTHFTVSRPGGVAHVDVSRGVVEVTSRGETVRVRAGESWPATTPAPAPSPTPTAGLDVVAPPAALPDDRPRSPAPKPHSAHAQNIARNAGGRAPATPPTPESIPAGAPPLPEASAPTVAPPAGPSPQEVYESAAKLEATKPEDALASYRKVAAGSGMWAANALFAEGRLEADRGHRAESRRLLNEYLGRFPRGPNAGDAKDLLERSR